MTLNESEISNQSITMLSIFMWTKRLDITLPPANYSKMEMLTRGLPITPIRLHLYITLLEAFEKPWCYLLQNSSRTTRVPDFNQ